MRIIDARLVGWGVTMICNALEKGQRKGRSGWQDCSPEYLRKLAYEHVMRGETQYVDAAVLLLMAAFVHYHTKENGNEQQVCRHGGNAIQRQQG